MKIMKVFDCQYDMSEDVRKEFFNCYKDNCTGNNVYVKFTVDDTDNCFESEDSVGGIVSQWLKSQGCEQYEDVIIKHWW